MRRGFGGVGNRKPGDEAPIRGTCAYRRLGCSGGGSDMDLGWCLLDPEAKHGLLVVNSGGLGAVDRNTNMLVPDMISLNK